MSASPVSLTGPLGDLLRGGRLDPPASWRRRTRRLRARLRRRRRGTFPHRQFSRLRPRRRDLRLPQHLARHLSTPPSRRSRPWRSCQRPGRPPTRRPSTWRPRLPARQRPSRPLGRPRPCDPACPRLWTGFEAGSGRGWKVRRVRDLSGRGAGTRSVGSRRDRRDRFAGPWRSPRSQADVGCRSLLSTMATSAR